MKTLKDIARKSFLSEAQLSEVERIIKKHGNYNDESIREAVDWFCTGLGMPDHYFQTTPLKTLAGHIEAIKAAEIIAAAQRDSSVEIDLQTELESEAIYLVDDRHRRAYEIERRIESKYPGARLKSYRTAGKGPGVEKLRMYLVEMPEFCEDDVCP